MRTKSYVFVSSLVRIVEGEGTKTIHVNVGQKEKLADPFRCRWGGYTVAISSNENSSGLIFHVPRFVQVDTISQEVHLKTSPSIILVST